jgi:hypothetical protein
MHSGGTLNLHHKAVGLPTRFAVKRAVIEFQQCGARSALLQHQEPAPVDCGLRVSQAPKPIDRRRTHGAKAHSLCDFILLGGHAFAPVLVAFLRLPHPSLPWVTIHHSAFR